jgi:NADH:ubiquinone oxidoreductase subunit 3 (subunit A)
MYFSSTLNSYSQTLPDSTKAEYYAAKTDKEKGKCLLIYFRRQANNAKTKEDILSLKSWFEKQHDDVGTNYTILGLASILETNGDLPGSLKVLFSVLPKFEERKDSFGIYQTYSIISATYMAAKDYVQAAKYSKMGIAFAGNDQNLISRIYNGIACIYGEGKMPDSGMAYAEKAGEYDVALPFLKRTAAFYKRDGARGPYLDAYLKNDFAEVFLATKMYDSSRYYARQALLVSVPFDIKDQSMRSYEYLYKGFEQTNQQDSLNKYFRLSMIIKDSLLNLEKVKSIEALTFQEQLRQQEADAEKARAGEERQQNIQYALMALGIISFVIVFLLLSRRHITNTKVIRFLGVVALLVVFEFLNLLLHPPLEKITHHSPVLMLLALVCIAALLVPLHHRIEKWTTTKLVEKNKTIRLAAAKKTVEQLERTEKL